MLFTVLSNLTVSKVQNLSIQTKNKVTGISAILFRKYVTQMPGILWTFQNKISSNIHININSCHEKKMVNPNQAKQPLPRP